jgi:aspartate/methionine/tyrosine aminotransferase
VSSKNLTGYEIDSLHRCLNLTDGHAFRQWSAAEEEIIERSPRLFRNHSRQMQAGIEREYIKDFLHLGKQTWDGQAFGYLMCFTASMAFEIIANYLRLNQLTLTLIEPCFDNLADIFLRHRIPVLPFSDAWLESRNDEFQQALSSITTDAICLVTPNNPTGNTLSEENLRSLVTFCKQNQIVLILDNCFRAYLPRNSLYDQHRIILDADIDAFLIEDTGKTWPTAEIKAPFFAVTRGHGLFEQTYAIYTDFLLHVSPVGIKLVHEFVRLSQQDDMAYIHEIVAVNRTQLYESISGTFLTPVERRFSSVAWLRIDHKWDGLQLKQFLDERSVFVLPGHQFFWHDRRQGERFIRVALTRDAEMFREAVSLLGDVCRELIPVMPH